MKIPVFSTFASSGPARRFGVRILCLVASGLLAGRVMGQQYYYVTKATDNGGFLTGEGSSAGGFAGDFRYCWIMSQYYSFGARPATYIIVQHDVTLTRPLPPWIPTVPQDLTVRGEGATHIISGANAVRVLFVDAPGSKVTVQNLQLVNGLARGGIGRGRAGGGAGLGGAIFVGAGTVDLLGVSFTNNAATGGASDFNGGNGNGGGGGIFGEGGEAFAQNAGGGGGYFGRGGLGVSSAGGGGGGISTKGNDAFSSFGGGGGGTTEAGNPDTRSAGAAGGSGGDNSSSSPDAHFFVDGLNAVGLGGGGGGGGAGGGNPGGFRAGKGGNGLKYGGGGGAGNSAGQGADGGNGGDYAGGGGSPKGKGGNGGFGGGGGAGDFDRGLGGFGAGNGGGGNTQRTGTHGSGFGGSIFLRAGANLVVRDASIAAGTVTAGGAGASAAGDGIYVMAGASLTFDLTGSSYVPVAGGIAGEGGVFMSGPGNTTTELRGTNTYSGLTIVQYGTLRLGAPAALSPSTWFNIYDYGTVDVFGNGFTTTPAQLGGSTGTIINGKPSAPAILTIAAAGAEIPVNVSLKDGASTLGLLKTGAGTLKLTGRSTASGGTTVQAGTLELAGGDQAGTGTLNNSLVINPGATVNATVPNAFGYNPGSKLYSVTVNGSGVLNSPANADQGWGVSYTLNNGAVMSSNGGASSGATASKFAFGGPSGTRTSVLATGAAPSEIRGRVDLRPDDGQTVVDFNVATGARLHIPATITSAGGLVGLRKQGPGTLKLLANNTYTGGTTVDGGTLDLGGDQSGIGNITGGLVINPGATVTTAVPNSLGWSPGTKINGMTINGGTFSSTDSGAANGDQGWGVAYTLINGAVLSSNGGVNSGTTGSKFAFGGPADNRTSVLATGAAPSEIRGRVDLRPEFGQTLVDINVADGAQLNISAAITSAGGPVGLRKTGNGILVLTQANTYQGGTRIEAGTLAVGSAAALGTANITFAGGTFRYDGFNADLSARINPSAGQPIRIDTNGQNVTFASGLTGDSNLGKWGPGTLTMAGVCTYTGATNVLAGTLAVAASGRLGSGPVGIAPGATLDLRAFGSAGYPMPAGTVVTNSGTILGSYYFVGTAPEMVLEQPAGTALSTGATVAFGAQLLATSTTKSFTLRNTAPGQLNVSVSLTGPGAASFFLNTTGMSSSLTALPGYDATTFSVSFSPTVSGVKTATLRIVSNDSDEGTTDITLTGEGYLPPDVALELPGGAALPDGALFMWGYNQFGQAAMPAGLSGVAAMSGGRWHSLGLRVNGAVSAWGYNFDGQSSVPANLPAAIAVAAGGYHSAALLQSGTVVAWGYNGDNQSTVPPGLNSVTAIAAGERHTVALKQDGTVVAWGSNSDGQRDVPAGLSGVKAIAAGAGHTVALKSDGTVVVWGATANGQGNVPAGLSGVQAIAAGTHHTLALKTDGIVAAWGLNDNGQCTVPAGLTGVVAISAGTAHSVALKNDGTVVAWGGNSRGQSSVPAAATGVSFIAAGWEHTLAGRAASLDFGSMTVGSAGPEQTIVIKNTGGQPLNITSQALTGAHAADFTVSTVGMVNPVPPGGQTSLGIRFQPGAAGPRTAILQISSNDPDESVAGVHVSGTGTLTALESWRQTWFGTTANTGTAADSFDYDLDGLSNLVEFAFGLNPTDSASTVVPVPVNDGSSVTYSFVPPAGVSGVEYIAEWSTDAVNWNAIPRDNASAPVIVFSMSTVGHERLFTRIRVAPSP